MEITNRQQQREHGRAAEARASKAIEDTSDRRSERVRHGRVVSQSSQLERDKHWGGRVTMSAFVQLETALPLFDVDKN